ASVACTESERERHPARHAARGGLGAVMGSKGLKYVSVEAGKAKARVGSDKKAWAAICKQSSKDYLAGPQLMKTGTSTTVPLAQVLHTFPYKNRVEGQSPDAETLDGHRILESFEERGGGMHNCMTGCIVKCSNVVHDAEETLTLLGSNCAIQSWEDVADLDRLCDEVGLDTIETGAAIAIYMDSGGMEFGDAEGAKGILKEIAEGTELGRMIGNGALETGKRRKHHRIPTVRGQAIPAWDPRPLKATGVTYLTSAQGADHTAGLVVNPGLAAEQLPQASQDSQLLNAIVDASGFCMFLMLNADTIRRFYSAYFGREFSREEFYDLGWQILEDEWEFNKRAGWKREEDVMPACMEEDKIGPLQVSFDVPHGIVQKAYEKIGSRDSFWEAESSA
ncbi:MAG: aldehyde ferredoxin oxidoreductase C-terminal domain-containing protein, partial [Gemmatimonadales bacterium]